MNKPKFADQHVDVADHRHPWNWLQRTAREDQEGYIRLTGGNERRLRAVFGEPDWKNEAKEASATWTTAWSVAEFGLNFIITTSPHSTFYYIRTPTDGDEYLGDARVGIGATEFLKSMLKRLRTPY